MDRYRAQFASLGGFDVDDGLRGWSCAASGFGATDSDLGKQDVVPYWLDDGPSAPARFRAKRELIHRWCYSAPLPRCPGLVPSGDCMCANMRLSFCLRSHHRSREAAPIHSPLEQGKPNKCLSLISNAPSTKSKSSTTTCSLTLFAVRMRSQLPLLTRSPRSEHSTSIRPPPGDVPSRDGLGCSCRLTPEPRKAELSDPASCSAKRFRDRSRSGTFRRSSRLASG